MQVEPPTTRAATREWRTKHSHTPHEKRRRSISAASARTRRTREQIVDALIALIEEGVESSVTSQVARRAGVSLRTVYCHYPNIESLYGAAIQRSDATIAQLIVSLDPQLDTNTRARLLVQQRLAAYERAAPLRRAIYLRPEMRSLRSTRDAARRFEYVLVRHASETFADELRHTADRYGAAQRIAAVTSFEMWQHLTVVQRLSRTQAGRHMIISVLRELGA
jgi:AcrR family transcriptional regulator